MYTQLNTIRSELGGAMDQFIHISISINSQNQVKKDTCISSFRRVNMHPNHCIPFDECINILDNHGFLSADKFFTKINGLNDTMP